MKTEATESSNPNNEQRHVAQFTKVEDGRKQPIRGLWQRNGRYYAQMTFEDANTGDKKVRRVPLVDKDGSSVATVPQAQEAMRNLMVQRNEDNLPVLRRTPRLKDFVTTYLNFIKAGQEGGQTGKKKKTIYKEEHTLKLWTGAIGGVRVDKIRMPMINKVVQDRRNAGRSNRTVKLDIIALRNVLKHARAEGWIRALPMAGMDMKQFKTAQVKRPLFTAADLEKFCAAAMETKDGKPVTKNAEQFCDYVRLLAYCGAREQEALALCWGDVDQKRQQLTIGATGDTKNSTTRIVDFNPKLRAHLKSMASRRAQDCKWVFPSPQRGKKDIHANTFRESLKLVRAHVASKERDQTEREKMAGVGFHDWRHHFISYTVMSGIDFMTIAAWVGHRDGGVLIGKVYGHLANEHRKAMADKVNFGPVVLAAVGN